MAWQISGRSPGHSSFVRARRAVCRQLSIDVDAGALDDALMASPPAKRRGAVVRASLAAIIAAVLASCGGPDATSSPPAGSAATAATSGAPADADVEAQLADVAWISADMSLRVGTVSGGITVEVPS